MEPVQREYMPGSEWIYFKIYAGHKTVDKILPEQIFSIIEKLKSEKLIIKWFFIRYEDPDFHLRIRFLVTDPILVGNVINIVYEKLEALLRNGLIWRIQLDTYNRELERYGGSLITEAESFFCIDSECILSIIEVLNRSREENFRWMIALKLIDSLLSDFSYSIIEKQQLMSILSYSYKIEFGFNKQNLLQFKYKYREKRKVIESVLQNLILDPLFTSLYLVITDRSESLKPVIDNLNKKANKDVVNRLLQSYIHMTMNRLFRSRVRHHELILYDFMCCYYASTLARSRNKNNGIKAS